MKLKRSAIEQLRKQLWHTHRLQEDTDLYVIEGKNPPEYFTGKDGGGAMQIGIRWVEQHYPEAFREIMKERIKNPTGI